MYFIILQAAVALEDIEIVSEGENPLQRVMLANSIASIFNSTLDVAATQKMFRKTFVCIRRFRDWSRLSSCDFRLRPGPGPGAAGSAESNLGSSSIDNAVDAYELAIASSSSDDDSEQGDGGEEDERSRASFAPLDDVNLRASQSHFARVARATRFALAAAIAAETSSANVTEGGVTKFEAAAASNARDDDDDDAASSQSATATQQQQQQQHVPKAVRRTMHHLLHIVENEEKTRISILQREERVLVARKHVDFFANAYHSVIDAVGMGKLVKLDESLSLARIFKAPQTVSGLRGVKRTHSSKKKSGRKKKGRLNRTGSGRGGDGNGHHRTFNLGEREAMEDAMMNGTGNRSAVVLWFRKRAAGRAVASVVEALTHATELVHMRASRRLAPPPRARSTTTVGVSAAESPGAIHLENEMHGLAPSLSHAVKERQLADEMVSGGGNYMKRKARVALARDEARVRRRRRISRREGRGGSGGGGDDATTVPTIETEAAETTIEVKAEVVEQLAPEAVATIATASAVVVQKTEAADEQEHHQEATAAPSLLRHRVTPQMLAKAKILGQWHEPIWRAAILQAQRSLLVREMLPLGDVKDEGSPSSRCAQCCECKRWRLLSTPLSREEKRHPWFCALGGAVCNTDFTIVSTARSNAPLGADVHRALNNETPLQIARKYNVPLGAVIKLNQRVFGPHFTPHAKLYVHVKLL